MTARAQAAFGGRLSFGRSPVLLVVDVVRAYLEPGSALYAPAFPIALAACERIVGIAREAGCPVIFTSVAYQPGGADGGLFYRKVPALAAFETGRSTGDFPASLRPAVGEVVVTKQYASAFFGTSLAATLTAAGVDTVVIIGFSTSGCVRATAVDALQSGFIPFVVRDGCGDRAPGPHESNLFDLQTKYAEVVGETELAALLDTAISRKRRSDLELVQTSIAAGPPDHARDAR